VRNTPDGVRVVDVPVPDGPGVRVRVRSAGICGSDLEMVRTGIAMNTLGHEIAGVTDDGDEVAIHPFVSCGQCGHCKSGMPQLCAEIGDTILGIMCDGGMAEELLVDPSCLSPLPSGVDLENASLVEPAAVALHACNRAGITAGMQVGVIGAGTIGLLCGAVARHLGADVHITARHQSQRVAAEGLGVSIADARDCDVVIEAAGTASGFDAATQRCARGGTIVLASTTWEPLTISFMNPQLREQAILPVFAYGEAHEQREFDTAATILAAVPEIAPTLITHRFGLDEATRAFEVAGDRAHGAIKVVLHP
jgi:threonine dehydrogenase-like Zn-dependent dehydrogenase